MIHTRHVNRISNRRQLIKHHTDTNNYFTNNPLSLRERARVWESNTG